jgi:iron(III) transport system permease protein
MSALAARLLVGRRFADRGYFGYIGVALAALLLLVVLTPIGIAVLTSFRSAPVGEPGVWTLASYRAAVGDSTAAHTLLNTVEYALGAASLALILASIMAWTVTRVQIPGKRVLRMLPLLSLALPNLIKDIAWIELYSPRSGLVNVFLQQVVGVHGPFNIYTMWGMIAVTGTYVTPIAYLILLAPFESLDPSLEEASLSSGVSRLKTQFAINARVLMPAFASAFALTLIIVAGTFEAPTLIGLPGGITTYVASIYRALENTTPNFPLASAQAVWYLLLTFLIFWFYVRSTRREQRFVTVTGRGPQKTARIPAWLAAVLVALMLFYFAIAFVLPLLLSLVTLFVPIYTLQAGHFTGTWSLHIVRTVLGEKINQQAIRGSAEIACFVAVFAALAGAVLSYVALKTRVRGRRVAEIVATIPVAMPGLVFSVTILISFVTIGFIRPFYNTLVPMIVVDVLVALPFTVRILSAALIQIDTDLIRASAVCGARPFRTVTRILVPLIRGALVNALIIAFIIGYRELSAILLIAPTNGNFIPPLAWGYWSQGLFDEANVLNLVTIVVPLSVAGVVLLLRRVLRMTLKAWASRSPTAVRFAQVTR